MKCTTDYRKNSEEYIEFVEESPRANKQGKTLDEKNKIEEGHAILDEMVGFCESDQTDGSVKHDEVIYELRSKP